MRIPRLAYERYLQRPEGGGPQAPTLDALDPKDDREGFRETTAHDPETWIEEWRSGSLPDTPENTRLAIRALALRDAPRAREREATTAR